MKKIATLVCAICALVGGQNASAQLLYKVEKPGTKTVSYVFGTHHFAPVTMIDSIAGLKDAVKNVDCLYGEVDMSLMAKPETMMAMQQMMVAPADSTLDKVYTSAQLDSIAAVFDHYSGGMPALMQLLPMKPAAVASLLSANQAMQILPPFDPNNGIDQQMQTLAREAGKEIGSLETVEFQLQMLFGKSVREQADDLMKTIRENDKEMKNVLTLTKAYLSQDMGAIEECIYDPENMDAEALDEMLLKRNDSWTPILTKEMAQRPVMVVVGAGHLPGDRGVLEQLRKAGYKVTPVK